MIRYKSKLDREIELTIERKGYILAKHPELKRHYAKIAEALTRPDQIRVSKRDNKVLLFYKYFAKVLGGKYIVVVIKLNLRNFIITAHVTDKIKIGEKYEYQKGR